MQITKGRVLYVDDNEDTCDLIRLPLKSRKLRGDDRCLRFRPAIAGRDGHGTLPAATRAHALHARFVQLRCRLRV